MHDTESASAERAARLPFIADHPELLARWASAGMLRGIGSGIWSINVEVVGV